MAIAVLLVFLGAATRLLPHPPNAVAFGALALYAGARLPRRWAFATPLAAMVLSDAVIDSLTGLPVPWATRMTIYGTFALIVALGRLPRADAGPATRAGMSMGASVLFFATSNFAVWATGWGYGHGRTAAGLLACYADAIPFFQNMLLADLVGTAALFGLDALARRVAAREPARAVEAISSE
jgi:hypothetical protein